MNHTYRQYSNRLRVVEWLLLGLLLLACRPFVSAQVEASITGTIEDSSGAAVSGATVTVTDLETGAARSVSTDNDGEYRVLSLAVGRYRIKVEKAGFKTQVQTGIALVVGQQEELNLKLEVGDVQQQVTVTASGPIVNTETQSVSGLVSEQQVKDLPLNGRSFDNLISLNTGVANVTALASTAASNGLRNFFSVAGRRTEQTLFLLNGVEFGGIGTYETTPDSASGQLLGIDAIREFNVLTDSYSAAYGKMPGAQISLVTQSGTNQLHGSIFEFLRNSALDGRNYFDQGSIPPFKRNQFGGAAGLPIQKDKTFIFANYEGFRQLLNLSNVTIVPDLNARQGVLPNAAGVPTPVVGLQSGMLAFMALWPIPNGPELGGGEAEYFGHPRETIQEDFGTMRFDHNFSDKDSFSVIYLIDDGFNATPAADPLFIADDPVESQVASVQEQHIFSSQLINMARMGFTRAYSAPSTPGVTPFPANLSMVAEYPPGTMTIGASGGASVGAVTGAGGVQSTWLVRNLFTYTDDVQWVHGKHQFSFGGWFQPLEQNDNAAGTKAGSASFTSLTTFLQGTVSSFTGNAISTEMGYRMKMGAWYVEDNIALRHNLALRLGLRHEFDNGWNAVDGKESNYIPDANGVLETAPLLGNLFTQNNAKWLFNPRGGLAWDVFGTGKTSVHVAGGVYHQLQDALGNKPDGTPPYNGLVSFNGNTSDFLSLIPIQPGVQLSPTCGPGVPSPCTIFAPNGVQPTMKVPTVDEWNLSVEQQVSSNTVFSAAYVGSHSVHELVTVDNNSIHPEICSDPSGCVSGGINKTTGTVDQGVQYIPVGTRPNPYLSNALLWYSEGSSSYNALQLDLRRRFTHGMQYRINYTWSKNMDSGAGLSSGLASNEATTIMEPYNLRNNWGPAAYDIRDQTSISGGYELPFGHEKAWLNRWNGVGDKLISGWQANWIVALVSGLPFSPQIGSNQSGNGDTHNPDRPSWNPSFNGKIITGEQKEWYNPNAFLIPESGTWGNVSRDPLRGPQLVEPDISLFKNTNLTDRLKMEFRTEAFNFVNHTNFSYPNITVFSGGTINPAAGLITATATTSRQIQFGLKLMF